MVFCTGNLSNGAFTLHRTGTETGTGDGTRINGFLYIMFTVHTALRQGQERDPLSPIVLVPFPVDVPVPVPCSVNKPLKITRKGNLSISFCSKNYPKGLKILTSGQ